MITAPPAGRRSSVSVARPKLALDTASFLMEEPTVTEKTASSGCAVEFCEAVTVTVLLASCASRGRADIKSKTMTRRSDVKGFYYERQLRSLLSLRG